MFGVFSCILMKVKNIIKLKNLKIFHSKEIVMKNKLIVANTYLNSTSDQFCFVTITFYNTKAAYQFVNISYTFSFHIVTLGDIFRTTCLKIFQSDHFTPISNAAIIKTMPIKFLNSFFMDVTGTVTRFDFVFHCLFNFHFQLIEY